MNATTPARNARKIVTRTARERGLAIMAQVSGQWRTDAGPACVGVQTPVPAAYVGPTSHTVRSLIVARAAAGDAGAIAAVAMFGL